MRIALVHDYLSQDGGAERVLKTMHEIWPEAPIFVLFHDQKKIDYLPTDKIRQSFLSKLPLIKNIYQWYLPLMPVATEKYHLKNFDVVISSTSAFAKGVIVHPHTLHISYCHTPPRYLWADTHEYLDDLHCGFLGKTVLPNVLHHLRLWDKASTDRVDHFIANSQTVQKRIAKYYRRDSQIIYPPVDTQNYTVNGQIRDYFVAGGRLVPYKKIKMVVQAFNRLGWPINIFGIGPELSRLKKLAKPNVQFLGKITDEEKYDLLSHAKAFIHPQIEDFGLTPIESMAAGRPVIAYREGGASETIIPDVTGIFFPEQTWESLIKTLVKFNPENWDTAKIRARAECFNSQIFKDQLKKFVEQKYYEYRN